MVTCPVCGWKMRRDDIRRGGFACPGCKERLRVKESREGSLVMVVSGVVGILIPYLAGAQGYVFLWEAVIAFLVIFFGTAVLRGLLFLAKLERDPGADDGTILHVTGPPDSSNKS